MSLDAASANDLMMLAIDQFSRGIFHMPHPQHAPPPASSSPSTSLNSNAASWSMVSSSSAPTPSNAAPALQESFSRAKELFTIASEVLLVAEKMEVPSERQYWASWADSVFNQMRMEGDMETWRGPITRARGRCWLIVGSANVEALEDALEADADAKAKAKSGDKSGAGDEGGGVLQSEDAHEAREALEKAISFLDKAKGSASASDPEGHELQPLLAEALLTLANLTIDEARREELYARAEAESADIELGERMDESDD